jgi:Raf kinase inhibitor-like YbhB/YbcL family protein
MRDTTSRTLRAPENSRRPLWLVAATLLLAGCGGGGDRLSGDLPSAPARLHLSSPAFTDGARLARRYTCDGAGDEPPVRAAGVPAATRELVVVVSDPDAPGGTFVHLTRFGLHDLLERGGQEGRNSAGDTGWTPPCPPSGEHRYIWTVYALRDPSGLKAGASPADVTAALHEHVLAKGTLTARYGRS